MARKLLVFLLFQSLALTLLAQEQKPPDGIKISGRAGQGGQQLIATSALVGTVTMCVDLELENAKTDKELPLTLTCAPGAETPLVTLSLVDGSKPWKVLSKCVWQWGDFQAEHDSDFPYRLPFKSKRSYKVVQGFGGKFSHTGYSQYAVDFRMTQGTSICAARGGVVVHVIDQFKKGGRNKKYLKMANVILIAHDDGTVGHYGHLKHKGARVKAGQKVKAGDVIGLSGNTGYSGGPHLHFSVFKPKDGRSTESLPFKFQLADGSLVTPRKGKKYKAP